MSCRLTLFTRSRSGAHTLNQLDRLCYAGDNVKNSVIRKLSPNNDLITATCQHEKNLHTVCLFTLYLLPFSVFQQRNKVHHTDDKDVKQKVLWNTDDQSSFKPAMRHTVLLLVVFSSSWSSSILSTSVIQNFVPFLFSLFAAFLSFSFLDQWRQLSLLPRVEISKFF